MKQPLRVGFCVSGQGRLFRAAAIHAEELGILPAMAVCEEGAAPDLEEFCHAHSITLVRLSSSTRAEFDAELARICIGAELDLISLTFDKMISPQLVEHYRGKIINVHPALLPAFPGMRAIEQALHASVRYTGATIHEIDEEVDQGPIIAQCVLGVRLGETPDAIGARLFGTLRLMYLQVLRWYAQDRVCKDEHGYIRIANAVYGEFPVSPAIEQGFPD